jgi:hypothetical protein
VELAKTSPVPKENHLFLWGISVSLWFLLEHLNTRLLHHKAISCRFPHLATDRPWCKRSYRRHPHREVSLCIRQLLPNLGLHEYPAITIKLKGLPSILECLGLEDFINYCGVVVSLKINLALVWQFKRLRFWRSILEKAEMLAKTKPLKLPRIVLSRTKSSIEQLLEFYYTTLVLCCFCNGQGFTGSVGRGSIGI